MTEAVSDRDALQPELGFVQKLGMYFALPVWMIGLVVGALWLPVTVVCLFIFPKLATLSLGLLLVAMLTPLSLPCPKPLARFLAYCTTAAAEYYPVRFIYEDKEEMEATKGPVIIGYEPHSVMPQAISMFAEYPHPAVVGPLRKARVLASSTGFWTPGMRHLWWWLGTRPVSKPSFLSQLRKQRSVALCPGGVQECLYMAHGKEVVYLRKRFGFVKYEFVCSKGGWRDVLQSHQSNLLFLMTPVHVTVRADWPSRPAPRWSRSSPLARRRPTPLCGPSSTGRRACCRGPSTFRWCAAWATCP